MSDNRLAIIVPVYNGGALLERTVASCGLSTLGEADAEVLVLDNLSDDGAPARLPARVGGLPVRVIVNERNLGRVGNWNRGVETATRLGFGFATFLFGGDTWVPGDGAKRLLEVMRNAGADLGLAPYRMVDEQGNVRRESARISISGQARVIPSGKFLAAMAGRGHYPITPLQANIYRLRQNGLPCFDDNRPLTTDWDATVDYLAASTGPVAITNQPFCAWLVRQGRVFCSSGLDAFMADHLRQVRYAEDTGGYPVDWTHAKSIFLISYLQNALTFAGWRGAPQVMRSAWRWAGEMPGAVNPLDMAALVARRFTLGESALHLR